MYSVTDINAFIDELFNFKTLFLVTCFDTEEAFKALTSFEALEAIQEIFVHYTKNSTQLCDAYPLINEGNKIIFNLLYSVNSKSLSQETLSSIDLMVSTCRDMIIQKPQNVDSYMEMLKHVINFLTLVPNNSHRKIICDKSHDDLAKEDYRSKSVMRAIFRILKFFKHQHQRFFVEDENHTSSSVDENLHPVLSYLMSACKSCRPIRKYCRKKILPPLKGEVKHLPETGHTLRNRLCQLMTANHGADNVSATAAGLIYLLCKGNVDRAIKYTGFGNFAGYLSNAGLLGGKKEDEEERYSSGSSDSETEDYRRLQSGINPVTGRWEPDFMKKQMEYLSGLSEEQKEYEVMQLVEKIDRLQREGFIKPATVGEDGSVKPVEHVLELLQHVPGDLRDKCHRPSPDKDEDLG
ncbi:Synembryn-B [Cichlidogyrus casuarinus]|uniref:Synembryn-B n=1 Tax=Cichlidogyrus casuarinus TaxID=1844966 RepID=A0ABD2Q585_9PLAT